METGGSEGLEPGKTLMLGVRLGEVKKAKGPVEVSCCMAGVAVGGVGGGGGGGGAGQNGAGSEGKSSRLGWCSCLVPSVVLISYA